MYNNYNLYILYELNNIRYIILYLIIRNEK